MRAAVCEEYGPPESVTIQDIDLRSMGSGVRVRVHAAAVNFPDVLIVANQYQVSAPTPFVPGSEFAGEIVETGERVFGTGMVGAFAEEIVVERRSLSSIPDGVDYATAAAFGVAHRTAWHALRSVASVQPGEELIVLGAGGGVGLAAVQLGAHLGATVTAVASSEEKLAAAKASGATHLVDHRGTDLRNALKHVLPEGADVVVDPVGGSLSEPALRALGWGGRFVVIGFAAGDIPKIPLNLVLLKGISIRGFEFRGFATHHAEEMERNDAELLQLLADGVAKPHIGARFPLARTAEALRYVADGKAVGKVIIEI